MFECIFNRQALLVEDAHNEASRLARSLGDLDAALEFAVSCSLISSVSLYLCLSISLSSLCLLGVCFACVLTVVLMAQHRKWNNRNLVRGFLSIEKKICLKKQNKKKPPEAHRMFYSIYFSTRTRTERLFFFAFRLLFTAPFSRACFPPPR